MFTIYFDEETEEDWFRSLHPLLKSAESTILKERGENPKEIDQLASYDRPDIIVTRFGNPILVLEKTREVPTGHNVGQRMARLVRALEMNVPVLAFFPFDARKHGEYSGICNLNVRILEAFEAMWRIHNTPIVAINWKADQNGELIGDGTEDLPVRELIGNFFDGNCSLPCSSMSASRVFNQEEHRRRVIKRKSYGTPPKSVSYAISEKFVNSCAKWLSDEESSALLARKESVIYNIGMEEESCRREDPFTGTQFIYDYAYCRNGVKVQDKYRNLILSFPKIRKNVWLSKNPNDLSRKSCNWYLTANALVFSDGAIWLR